jgi:hypothetical protein
MKIMRLGLLISLASLLTACSSFLYYPSRIKYVKPESLKYPPEELTFYQDDQKNEKLVAWHFKTPGKAKGIFLIFHGNAQNVSTHFWTLYWALDKGYDIFIFDYPGYGGSKGEPTPMNTLDSGRRAIEYVQNKWPDEKIMIMGQSLGGAIALRAVADLENRKNICAFVADSTFTSYTKVGQTALAHTWLTWPFQWLPYLVLSNRFSPKGKIDKISPIPLLVVHRKDDPIVASSLGRQVFDEAKEPKQLAILEGNGHTDEFIGADRVENQKMLLDFLKVCDTKQEEVK